MIDLLPPVRVLGERRTNADAIVDCARLGYLTSTLRTLDPTWGLGRFWSKWRPDSLTGSDLNVDRSPCGVSVDFTALPFDAETYDAVVLDGPYKLNGTSGGGGPATSDADYGVDSYATLNERLDLIRAGIGEAIRVVAPGRRYKVDGRYRWVGGTVLVKCQDQVCGGRKRWQTRIFADHAESLGVRLVDQLLVQGYRVQPAGRRQDHAHTDYSTLLIFRKETR
jgi:hypothetical protein